MRPLERVHIFGAAGCGSSTLGWALAQQLWNGTEPSLPYCADIDSLFFRLRDQPCPVILRILCRSCVSE